MLEVVRVVDLEIDLEILLWPNSQGRSRLSGAIGEVPRSLLSPFRKYKRRCHIITRTDQ